MAGLLSLFRPDDEDAMAGLLARLSAGEQDIPQPGPDQPPAFMPPAATPQPAPAPAPQPAAIPRLQLTDQSVSSAPEGLLAATQQPQLDIPKPQGLLGRFFGRDEAGGTDFRDRMLAASMGLRGDTANEANFLGGLKQTAQKRASMQAMNQAVLDAMETDKNGRRTLNRAKLAENLQGLQTDINPADIKAFSDTYGSQPYDIISTPRGGVIGVDRETLVKQKVASGLPPTPVAMKIGGKTRYMIPKDPDEDTPMPTAGADTRPPSQPPPPPQEGAQAPLNYTPEDRDALTRMLATEALGEGTPGMIAAGSVALNRARSGYGGAQSIKDVVYAKNQFEGMKNAKLVGSAAYQKAQAVADQLLSGEAQDPTGGATQFINPVLQAKLGRAQPKWATGDGLRIGNHVFYGGTGAPAAAAAGGAGVPAAARTRTASAIADDAQAPPGWQFIGDAESDKDWVDLSPEEAKAHGVINGQRNVNTNELKLGPAIPQNKGNISPEERAAAKGQAIQQAHDNISLVNSIIGRLGTGIDVPFTGGKREIPIQMQSGMVGKWLGEHFDQTSAGAVAADLQTLKAQLGFQQLQAMRAASPTGGALGQVSNHELDLLTSAVSSLRQGLDRPVLVDHLNKVKAHFQNWLDLMQKAEAAGQVPAGTVAGITGGSGGGGGIRRYDNQGRLVGG